MHATLHETPSRNGMPTGRHLLGPTGQGFTSDLTSSCFWASRLNTNSSYSSPPEYYTSMYEVLRTVHTTYLLRTPNPSNLPTQQAILRTPVHTPYAVCMSGEYYYSVHGNKANFPCLDFYPHTSGSRLDLWTSPFSYPSCLASLPGRSVYFVLITTS